ncbi:hypothetical protein BN2475_50045 [Paraburkholderia ribeironis]|uniref:Uncharacterized protein n=1 Tax=Paraburkholderia ribeironis TaxID=1247936 RepID=A0A1N7RK92_9BURK|nr:hypothetical protein [Paraburkholderia ribeironis]SIT35474.1 hypothetical protein BN2475_50045 [Paraburkholderia ribeironis]
MNKMDEVSGIAWPVVKDSEVLLKLFGRYPSFHDANVLSITMERAKRMRRYEPLNGPVDPHRLEFVDVILEVLHREDRPAAERIERPDYAITIALLDVRSADIDINAMLDDSFVSEISRLVRRRCACPGLNLGYVANVMIASLTDQ